MFNGIFNLPKINVSTLFHFNSDMRKFKQIQKNEFLLFM
uniref:Uncharacterized protein n=1 Tax=Anguilla anguilla TaxID=7936 RepID=A0A0E9X9Q3_ANGAN